MTSDSQSVEQTPNASGSQDSTACPNCRALMPQGMRFCRQCGFRLGEGVEDYTETVRLGNQPQGRTAFAQGGAQSQGAPYGAQPWGAMSPAGASQVAFGKKKRRSKGPHWIVWVILSVVIASVAGGSFIRPLRINIGSGGGASGTGAAQSKVGASKFSSEGGGAMVISVSTPDGPMDKAGLVGGDVITSFDGKPVTNDSELRKQIAATPIGKTVEVVYTRDGETKKTTLTTVSEDEIDRLDDIAENIPDGFLGIDGLHRIAVPNTNIYGVQVDNVIDNRPAKMAGLQDGDIITEFGGTPIRTAEELGNRIDRTKPYSTVKTVIYRGAERMEIEVKVGIDD